MHWLYYIGFGAICTTAYATIVKLSSQKIDPLFAVLVMQFTAFIVAILVFGFMRLRTTEDIMWTQSGVTYSIMSGVVIMFANLCIFLMYNSGAPLSIASPAMRIAGTILTFIVGLIFFREDFTMTKMMGITLSITGVYLLLLK